MEDISTYIRTLGLNPNKGTFSAEELKKAWRALCMEHHPDKGGNPDVFRAVTHAYRMLTDPEYKIDFERKQKGIEQNLDIQIVCPISFEDAFFGREVRVSFNRVKVDETFTPITGAEMETVIEAVTINVPAGSFGNVPFLFPDKGLICGDKSGKAMLVTQPMKSNRFQVEDMNIISELTVPLDIMLRGGEVEVMTMYGSKTIQVPPGQQPGARLDCGKFGVKKIGKHFAIIKPIFPTKDELKSGKWQDLKIDWSKEQSENQQKDDEIMRLFYKLGGGTSGTTTGP